MYKHLLKCINYFIYLHYIDSKFRSNDTLGLGLNDYYTYICRAILVQKIYMGNICMYNYYYKLLFVVVCITSNHRYFFLVKLNNYPCVSLLTDWYNNRLQLSFSTKSCIWVNCQYAKKGNLNMHYICTKYIFNLSK